MRIEEETKERFRQPRSSLLIKEDQADYSKPKIDGIPQQVLENSQTNDKILNSSAIEIERRFKQLDADWHARRKHPHKNLLIQQE